jgi:hypothetical protein
LAMMATHCLHSAGSGAAVEDGGAVAHAHGGVTELALRLMARAARRLAMMATHCLHSAGSGAAVEDGGAVAHARGGATELARRLMARAARRLAMMARAARMAGRRG